MSMPHATTALPRAWLWGGGAALLLALLGALAWWGTTIAAPQGGAGWAWLLAPALLLAALAGYSLGRSATRAADQQARAEAQAENRRLLQLLDVWQWHTDAQHHLLSLRPPQGAAAADWTPRPSLGQPLWQQFEVPRAAGSLRAQLQAQAALQDLVVCAAADVGEGSGARWSLRALPRFDAEGRFAGHSGTARPLVAASAEGATDAAGEDIAAAARSAAELAAEHAAFSYTVSHDLRSPIRVVEGFARILKEDYGRALDRVGNDHLDRVLAAAARMNSMIDAMLALARLSSQPLARQPVNLSQLAGFVVDDLRRGAPQRAADFEISSGLVVQGDPTLLRLLLDNLLGNAWKYSAKRERAHIALGCEERDGRTVFCVRDNGAGFDMRSADRLFGLFQRLHSASDFAGTGVGLASVRRIVRRHGGEIWAESEPGQGASFYFTLQAAPALPPR